MDSAKRDQLIQEGYCVFPGILPPELLANLQRVTVVTLWFHPDSHLLGERLQAFIGDMVSDPPATWPEETRNKAEAMLARYQGDAKAWPWNRHRPYPAPVA